MKRDPIEEHDILPREPENIEEAMRRTVYPNHEKIEEHYLSLEHMRALQEGRPVVLSVNGNEYAVVLTAEQE